MTAFLWTSNLFSFHKNAKKKKKKQNKKQNKQRRRRKKHPGPTFSHIDRRGLVNKGSITRMPKTNFFLVGQAIIKTLTVLQESFIKRVDHTSTGIPTLYKLQNYTLQRWTRPFVIPSYVKHSTVFSLRRKLF